MDDAAITVSTLSPDEGQRWEERETCYDEGVAVDIVTVIGSRAPRGTALMARRGELDVLWLGVADGSVAVRAPFVPAVPGDDEGAVGWLGRWEGATPELMVQTLERLDLRLAVRACVAAARRCVKPGIDVAAESLLLAIESSMDRRKGAKRLDTRGPARAAEKVMELSAPGSRRYQAAWAAFAVERLIGAESGLGWPTVCVRAAADALRKAGTKKPLPQIAAAIREVVPLGVAMASALEE